MNSICQNKINSTNMKFTTTTLVQIVIEYENKDERTSFNQFQMDHEIFAQYTPLRSPTKTIAYFEPDDAAKVEQYLTNHIAMNH